MGEPIRLQKILAYVGCGSRRACEKFIEEGRVTVDGAVVERLGSKADPETQVVALDGWHGFGHWISSLVSSDNIIPSE